jgi:uncharacterized membrane protein
MRNPASSGAVWIGVGLLGAFVDGILLHMLLEWHHMVSGWVPPTTLAAMHVNMRWDGAFHVFAWAATLLGIALVWRGARAASSGGAPLPTTRHFVGSLVLGAGLFNLVEGIIDHELLGIHHVRDVPQPLPYDLTFLLVAGVGFIAVGWGLRRAGEGREGRASSV